MKHEMKLKVKPFKLIKSGNKTIELRLYDEKRQLIKAGDEILFTCIDDNSHVICKVLCLHMFPNFKTLYLQFPKEKMGYEENEPCSYKDMEVYYSKTEQQQFGVVGIEIELI